MFTPLVAVLCAATLAFTDVLILASARFTPNRAKLVIAFSIILDFLVLTALITDLEHGSAPLEYMPLVSVGLEAGLFFRMRGFFAFLAAFAVTGWLPFGVHRWLGYDVPVVSFIFQAAAVITASWIAAAVAEESERRRRQAAYQARLNEALSHVAQQIIAAPQRDEVVATLASALHGLELPWAFGVLVGQEDGSLRGRGETIIEAALAHQLRSGTDPVIHNPEFLSSRLVAMICNRNAQDACDTVVIRCQTDLELVAAVVVAADGSETFGANEMEFFATLSHQACAALDRAALHEHVKELSLTDSLTRLRNRRAFDERLAEEISRSDRSGLPLGMIMLDIDHFKILNDTQGHPAGDRTLRQISEILQSPELLRDVDLSYRLGGEEFGVLLPGTGLSGVVALAERLCKAVGETVFPDASGQPLGHLTVSAGVALHFPGSGDSAKALIESSDLALYEAKRSGRDCVRSAPLTLRTVESRSVAG
jgi:diguanylate cyclase (GGDEF)-like protein